jgi:CRP-like cAMP-binding protein
MYADTKYRECEGLYIILRGYVDILSQKDNSVLHSLHDNDFFGFSKFIQKPSYEFLGDIYAGLYPQNSMKQIYL